MFKTIKTVFSDADIFKKIFFIISGLFIIRLLNHIPVPWVDTEMLQSASTTGLMSFANMFNSSVFASYTFGSIGISTYISSSILLQLISFIYKPLKKLRSEPGGEKTIKRINMVVGVIIAFSTSFITTKSLDLQYAVLLDDSWYVFAIIATIHAICAAFHIWIGEEITKTGLSDGISLIIASSILSRLPSIISSLRNGYEVGTYTQEVLLLFMGVLILMLIAVAIMEQSEKRIAVKYMRGFTKSEIALTERNNFLNIKFNLVSVMPVILTVYIFQFAAWIVAITRNAEGAIILQQLNYGTTGYAVVGGIIILFVSIFYSFMAFDASEVAYFLQTRGGIIPGIRPGRETSSYLRKEVNGLAFLSGLYLAVITMVPLLILTKHSLGVIETTSIIILMGTAMASTKTIFVEVQLANCKKFSKIK